jgi:hypothetical protein
LQLSLSPLPEDFRRDVLTENMLYLPFLGPVMPLLYYIGIGMMKDLAALPGQLLGWKNSGETMTFQWNKNT